MLRPVVPIFTVLYINVANQHTFMSAEVTEGEEVTPCCGGLIIKVSEQIVETVEGSDNAEED